MKFKFLLPLFMITISCNLVFAQQAIIKNVAVSPHKLKEMCWTTTPNSVSSGLNVIPNGTYIYLTPESMDEEDPVTSASWSFVSKPAGSTADFTDLGNMLITFKADVKGAYQVKLSFVTAKGSHDTTLTVYSADFIGNPAFDGVARTGLNCMTCHSGSDKFTDIYTRWQTSPHATKFKADVTTGSAKYNINCLKCHTVGYDHNIAAANNGFDDVAQSLGWKWVGPPNAGKWDSLKTAYPDLIAYSAIGCENCHGPASEHATGSGPKKETIDLSAATGACAQCHDEPWRHNKVAQYENSKHSEAVWESSFAQKSGGSYMKNDLGNCIRCHDGQGFVNFTKGKPTDTKTMTLGDHTAITCATCHDPHGNSKTSSLRSAPEQSDTLGNGYKYTIGGAGKLCMSCHKARRSVDVYTKSKVSSSHWGPHGSVQSDLYLGSNLADFGTAYNTTNIHQSILTDACVDCHMQATTDTGTVSRDKVGGHSWHMKDAENNVDHTKQCLTCHPGKTKFSDFTAKADEDGDGTVESIQDEVKGLLHKLRIALPPAGVDSISYQDIGNLNDDNIKKAYWNYLAIEEDGSFGMHNAPYVFAVLKKSLNILVTGVEQESGVKPIKYELSQNFPNPFNPTTHIKFSLPVAGNVTLKVYDAIGNEVATLHNGHLASGSYNVSWNAAGHASGIYFYKLESDNFSMTKKMVLIK